MPKNSWFAPAILPYSRGWLGADIRAGLSTGAIGVPLGMAAATVANMPVQMGLYTAMLPVVVFAFLSGSRATSVTGTMSVSTLTASTMLAGGVLIGSPDQRGDLVTLTLLVGVFLLIARVFRLGMLVDNISDMTVIGIKVATGLTVAAAQLPKLLGVSPEPRTTGFFGVTWGALSRIDHASATTVVISVISLMALVLLIRFAPRMPGPLVIMVLGIAVSAAVALPAYGVALTPPLPTGLPLPGLPNLDRHIVSLVPGALAISVMAFLETVAVARATRRPGEPAIQPDRELLALGSAAVAGSFFHSLPLAGGFSLTEVNSRSGARSQISGLVRAAVTLLVIVAFAPLIALLPQAVIGAVVVVTVVGLVDVKALRRLYRLNPWECAGAVGVALLGLTFGLITAVVVAVAGTMLVVVHVVNKPHMVQLIRLGNGGWMERAENAPLVAHDPIVLRCLVPLYAANVRANADAIREALSALATQPAGVVLDMVRQNVLESTVVDVLADLDRELTESGLRLSFAALPDRVRRIAQRTDWWQEVEAGGRIHPDVDSAVRSAGSR